MSNREILNELLNGNPAPLRMIEPEYNFDALSMDELQAFIRHHTGTSLMNDADLERITSKISLKPLTTNAELTRIAGIQQDFTKLSDEELRKIIQANENE